MAERQLTDRKLDRQPDMWAKGQIDNLAGCMTDGKWYNAGSMTDILEDRLRNRKRDIQTDRWVKKKTDGQTDWQTD
jgi:hypothetical protein